MTTISVENHLHRIQQRWCGQTKREREILVKLYSCGEIEYLHIQHLFHQKCLNLTCSILPPQSIIHTGQLISHVVTCCNATIFSGLSFLAAFMHIQARIVTQHSTLQSVAESRVQSAECGREAQPRHGDVFPERGLDHRHVLVLTRYFGNSIIC